MIPCVASVDQPRPRSGSGMEPGVGRKARQPQKEEGVISVAVLTEDLLAHGEMTFEEATDRHRDPINFVFVPSVTPRVT